MLKNLLRLVELFVEYTKGTTPVRMVVQIVLFMMLITWVGIIAIISLNFDTITDIYNRHQSATSINVVDALISSTQVNSLISDQRSRLDLDRLYVSKFHNGKVDINGIHFIYFSRISESNGPGISDELAQTQNLPLSIFPDMLTKLLQEKCYYIEGVDQTVENSSFLGSMGVNSMMVCPIYDISHRLIGIIGAEGVVKQINTSMAPQLELSLATLSGVLGTILTLQ